VQDACVAVAALLQYFLMAAFCWMFVEGIYLFLFVVKVYNIVDNMRVYHAISWGKANRKTLCFIINNFHQLLLLQAIANAVLLTDKQTKNFVPILGFPAVIVALSLGIVAGEDGVQSFVSDK